MLFLPLLCFLSYIYIFFVDLIKKMIDQRNFPSSTCSLLPGDFRTASCLLNFYSTIAFSFHFPLRKAMVARQAPTIHVISREVLSM